MNKLLFILLVVAASAAQAGVHKCKAPDGSVIYTDKGCTQGQDVTRQDRENDGAARKDAASPASGRGDFYREQVKSAEQSAPKSEQPRP